MDKVEHFLPTKERKVQLKLVNTPFYYNAVESHSSDFPFTDFLNSLIESPIPLDNSGNFLPPKRTSNTIAIIIISVDPMFCSNLNHILSYFFKANEP